MLPFFTKVEEKAEREGSSPQLGHELPESKVSCLCSEGHWPELWRALLGTQAYPIYSCRWETECGAVWNTREIARNKEKSLGLLFWRFEFCGLFHGWLALLLWGLW